MTNTDMQADGPYEGLIFLPIRYNLTPEVEEAAGAYAASVVRAAFREIANHGDWFDVPYHYLKLDLVDEQKTLRLVVNSTWNEEQRSVDLEIRLADHMGQIITKYGTITFRDTPDGKMETFVPFPDGKSIQELEDHYFEN